MKSSILLFFFLTIYPFAQAENKNERKISKKIEIFQVQPTTYTCPMHPEIHASKPGKCPKCGMDLIKEKAKPIKKSVPKKQTPKTVVKKQAPVKASVIQTKTATDEHQNRTNVAEDNSKVKEEPVKRATKNVPARTVRYDLYVKDTIVTFGDTPKRAIAVNGQIPMPTLTFTEGDIAEIYVHNEMDEDTSLHWHGIFLPNQYDGVPNLTQMPIKPHTSHKYTFPIIQHGTHWYHSHTGLQEQIGMYGLFIMNKKVPSPSERADREDFRKGIDDLPTIPIILSEWTDMKPENVHRMLHNASDWFAIQKGSTLHPIAIEDLC